MAEALQFHFHSELHQMRSDVWSYCIFIPEEVSSAMLQKHGSRVVCSIAPVTFHCALMPHGDGRFFITINKDTRKKLSWEHGESKSIQLTPDQSEYGMPMPREMQECLDLDPEAYELFSDLSPGKQRSLIYIVAKPKSADIKIKKALVILDYLKNAGGLLDYKDLNEAFKQANQSKRFG